MKIKKVLLLMLFLAISICSSAQQEKKQEKDQSSSRFVKEIGIGGYAANEYKDFYVRSRVGVLWKERFFLGGGLAVNYQGIKGKSYQIMRLPLFATVQYNLKLSNSFNFFTGTNVGFRINLGEREKRQYTNKNFYVEPELGFGVKIANNNYIKLSASYSYVSVLVEKQLLGLYLEYSF